jgi:hypothetical protein
MRIYSLVRVCSLVFSLPALAGSVAAQEPSGITIAAITEASASGVTGSRTLEVNGLVFNGDRVNTDDGGQAQIRFRDDTRLVVGPNSSLIIDSFVFNPDNSVRRVSMEAVKGTFRFFSGNGPKQAYGIRTPSSILGIRGTRFDFYVASDGRMDLVSYEGEVNVCDLTGKCVVLSGGCALVSTFPGGGMRQVPADTPERKARLSANFPYAVSQVSLRSDFKADVSACGLNTQSTTAAAAAAGALVPAIGGLVDEIGGVEQPVSP